MSQVRDSFPELQQIEDDDLRAGVVDAWETAVAETGVDDLEHVPWFPPAQRDLGLADEWLVPHVRDVTAGAAALAETLLDRRDADVALDTVIAGALVHDVSKLHEFDGMDETAVGDLIGRDRDTGPGRHSRRSTTSASYCSPPRSSWCSPARSNPRRS